MTLMTAGYALGFALLATAAWAADAPTPLDIKPGLWETTTTAETTGSPAIPPELLARMTPEQQARLEAQVKAGTPHGPHTDVRKHCVTKEELAKGLSFGDDHGSCKQTVLRASSGKREIRLDCGNSGIKATGTIRFEAIDREHVKISSEIASGDASHAMKIVSTGMSKWVSAPCTGDEKK
jgi:hypothetical protein